MYERVHTVYNEDDGLNHVEFFSCFWNGDKLVHITRYTKVGSESYTKTDTLHFYFDAEGKPSHVHFNDTRFFYQYNLQGDVIGILAGHHQQVVRYEYDAWGKVISITGSRKDNLGKYNPFRYRHYMYDDSVSLYYLKSRHYHPALCRFLQADTVLGKPGKIHNHNIYCYCRNSPVINSDHSGKRATLANDEITPFSAHDWGSHTTKLPANILISNCIQLAHEGDWKYSLGALRYTHNKRTNIITKEIDCIGIINLSAKFHMTKAAYRSFGVKQGTNLALKCNATPLESINNGGMLPGSIVYSANRSHVGVYIGAYTDEEGCFIDHAVVHASSKEGKVIIQPLFDSSFTDYCQYNYIDYDTSYEDSLYWNNFSFIVTEEVP